MLLMVWCGSIKHKNEIQADYWVAVLMHFLVAMHWDCIGCHSAYLVNCGDSGLGEKFFLSFHVYYSPRSHPVHWMLDAPFLEPNVQNMNLRNFFHLVPRFGICWCLPPCLLCSLFRNMLLNPIIYHIIYFPSVNLYRFT